MRPGGFGLHHLQAHGAVFFQNDDVVSDAFQVLAVALYGLAGFVVDNAVGNLAEHPIFAETGLKSGLNVRFVRFGHFVQPAPPFFIDVDAGAVFEQDGRLVRIAHVEQAVSFEQLEGAGIGLVARQFVESGHFFFQRRQGDAALLPQVFAQPAQFVQFLIQGVVEGIAVVQGVGA